MTLPKDLEFKAEDFLRIGDLVMSGDTDTGDAAAIIANRILAKKLEKATVVYGRNTEAGTKYENISSDWQWEARRPGNTHKAYLIGIYPLQDESNTAALVSDIKAHAALELGANKVSDKGEKC